MRTALLALLVVAVIAAAPASRADHDGIVLEGQLVGHPLAFGFSIGGASLELDNGHAKIVVWAEGNCHYEYDPIVRETKARAADHDYHPPYDPPDHPRPPRWECDRDEAEYLLPPGISRSGDDILLAHDGQQTKIGRVKRFLFWSWIKLESNVRIDAGYDFARLVVNPGKANVEAEVTTGRDALRERNFGSLHGVR
jgi:hypothetical protein